MESDSWVGVILLIAAVGLLTVVAAAEAGVITISRARALAARPGGHTDALHVYIEQRHALMGALSVARNLAVVLATGVGVFLVLRHIERTWLALAMTMLSALLALALIEAVPRLVIARSPEAWAGRLSPVMSALRTVFGAPPWLLAHLLRALRAAPEPAQGADELLRLVEMEEANGAIEEEERQMIRGVIGLTDSTAREIMVPRIDIVAAEVSDTIDDVLQLIVGKGFSRIPVYEETIDNVVGVVYAKDLMKFLAEGTRPPVREIMRPPHFIPESKKIDELLAELRNSRVHIAIVVDEYGGTAGIVTIEDLLEEIVGEIQDEYDVEEATIERIGDGEAVLDARVSIDAVNELFGLELEGEDYDTIGGFVYHHLGRVPVPGDEVRAQGLDVRVMSVAGRRIRKLHVRREHPPLPASGRGEKNGNGQPRNGA